MALGFVVQAMALYFGSLAVVQTLLVTEMVFVVLALWLWYSMDLRPRDAVSALAATGGVAVFLAAAAPTSGSLHPSDRLWWVVAGVVVVAITGLLVASRRGPDWWRALSMGASASVGFAFTAALTKIVTNLLTRGWSPLLEAWQTYGLIVFGLGSFFLMQSAFQVGPFAASQSTLILVNPYVSIAIGAILFGDKLHSNTADIAIETLSLLVMVLGAIGLSTSPLIVGVHDASPDSHLLAGRGRLAKWRARHASISTSS